MKLLIRAAIAAVALSSTLALPAAADPPYRGQQQQQDRGGGKDGQMRQDGGERKADAHRDRRRSWRDDRSEARWDDSQHNGYFENRRWHYGPPPSDRYGRQGFALGYQPWARGQRLGYYNGRYAEVDYREAHLRQPRRGYHWVRDDQGNFLLVAILTGVVASVILESDR